MRQSFGTDGQYLYSSVVNQWTNDAWKGAQEAAGVWALPGLIHPEAAQWSTSGMFVTGVFASPFACQLASGSGTSGVVAFAHGTTNGADTQTYSVNLSGLVPGSGSQLVYITASYAQIQQTPTSIVGPPPGNPAFNPGFVAFNAYTEMVDSLSLGAQTGVPNGQTVLELARTTLSAGQTGIALASLDFSHQVPAARVPTAQIQTLSGSNTLSTSQVGTLFVLTTDGATTTLPAASTWPGRSFRFFGSPSGSTYMYIQTNGSDGIWGAGGSRQVTGQVTLRQGAFLELYALGNNLISATESMGIMPLTFPLGGTPPSPMTYDSNGNLTLPQSLSVTDPGIAGISVVGSGGNGANIRLNGGGSAPYKFLRSLNGQFNILNSAYTANLFTLDDSGNLMIAGGGQFGSNLIASGNVEASNGVLLASFGARSLPSNSNVAAINADFDLQWNPTNLVGYMIFPAFGSDYILQWGVADLTAIQTNIFFPLTFPNACFGAHIMEAAAGGSWGEPSLAPVIDGAENFTTNGFTVIALLWDKGASEWIANTSQTVSWLAWGY